VGSEAVDSTQRRAERLLAGMERGSDRAHAQGVGVASRSGKAASRKPEPARLPAEFTIQVKDDNGCSAGRRDSHNARSNSHGR